MLKISPSEEPPDFGIGYRTRDGRPLGEVIAELSAPIRIVVREPDLTWKYWWSVTRRLIARTWNRLWS